MLTGAIISERFRVTRSINTFFFASAARIIIFRFAHAR
jgi:hypothetical protein